MKWIIITITALVLATAIWSVADSGQKSIVILVDSTANASANFDSTAQIKRYLDFGGYDYDIIYLTTEVSGSPNTPYATTREAFYDSLKDYSLIINPQEKIGIWGDTCSGNNAGSGLQPFMIQGLYDYVYHGGNLINLDFHLQSAGGDSVYMADTVLYNSNIWGFSLSASASCSSLIVPNKNIMDNVEGIVRAVDTFMIAASKTVRPVQVTAIANPAKVDTFAILDLATDRPYLIGTEYGLGGYVVQSFGDYRWLFPKFSDTTGYAAGWDLLTFGPGRGLDHTFFDLVDYLSARKGVQANFELGHTAYFQAIMTGGAFWRQLLPFYRIGCPVTLNPWHDQINADSVVALTELHKTNQLSIIYTSGDSTEFLWVDAIGRAEWTVAEWGDTVNVMKDMEDTSGSIFDGLLVAKVFQPHQYVNNALFPWDLAAGYGVDSCVVDSLQTWNVNFTNSIVSMADTMHNYRLGLPYYCRHMQVDWARDSVGTGAFFKDRLWCMRQRVTADWGKSTVITEAMRSAGVVGAADTVSYVNTFITDYLNKMAHEKIWTPIQATRLDLTILGQARYDSILTDIGKALDSLNYLKLPELYLYKLTCYRDSVSTSNYCSEKHSVSFTLTENCGAEMPVNLLYTVRYMRHDNIMVSEMVYLPKGWSGTLNCRSEYDRDRDRWHHSPGWKAENGHIKWSDFDEGGFF